ncbi:hypothetical protein ACFLYS_00330 [Chloroflexota bacterium]
MTDEVKLEKWQEVLTNCCSEWIESIKSNRENVLKEHGDLQKLSFKGKPKLKRESSASEVKIRIKNNKYTDVLHDINDEVRETGNEFVTNIIGLRPTSRLIAREGIRELG